MTYNGIVRTTEVDIEYGSRKDCPKEGQRQWDDKLEHAQ